MPTALDIFSKGLLRPSETVPKSIKGSSDRRYAVYRNNVTVGLVRAMEANFPAVRRLLGEGYFAGLAREFVQQRAPRSPLMFLYGEQFASYLEAQVDLKEFPYLADVARLEQIWRTSFHEADAPVLDAATFANISEEQLMTMRLRPHPAMALISSPHPVCSIFLANRGALVTSPIDLTESQCVLVTRPALTVELQSVAPGTAQFLRSLASDMSLGAAVENAAECDEGFDLAASLVVLLQSGAFQSMNI